MKLTKFVHSCLLAETADQTVLFDPGEFSWESGLFDIAKLGKLDAVVITHEHPDHFNEEFVKAIAKSFPEACFIAPPSVVAVLQKMGIPNAFCESTDSIRVFSTKRHASMEPLAPPPPENIAVHFAGQLTVGGDRHDLEESMEILALPITAPWGSVREGAEMVMRLKPKYVIPIHDWPWNTSARQDEYDRSSSVYKQHGITFIKPVDGQVFEI
ncbi:MAG TPA: MBL fold metallo-hydrolase [Candidatus Limnocylindria bacterium]|nr:MBL fold metallo-hydrolase [Candidatus Limnocylindria bacterium]